MRRSADAGQCLLLLALLPSCSVLYPFDEFRFDGGARASTDAPAPDTADVRARDAALDATTDAGADIPAFDAADAPKDVFEEPSAPCETASETRCDGLCVDTRTDRFNCGSCGTSCDAACSNGACVTVTAIATGSSLDNDNGHTCALMSDQTVRCWGSNRFGELGDGTVTARLRPTEVPGLSGVIQLTVGGKHTCVRRVDGAVLCWGDNSLGAIGVAASVPTRSPVMVPRAMNARWISAGKSHTCVVTAMNTVRCWGSNSVGQCGIGGPVSLSTPTDVPPLTGVTEVSAGGDHTCALQSDESVDCWGSNTAGQLGDRTLVSRPTPGEVRDLRAQYMVSGNEDTCAFNASGQSVCWGVNRYGLFGNSFMNSANAPTFTNYRGAVTGLSVGSYHACFLGTVGLMCAGLNTNGQLGDGTFANNATLTRVSESFLPSPVRSVSCGYEVTCAVFVNGVARCWGRNTQGQLGDGTTISQNVPTVVVF